MMNPDERFTCGICCGTLTDPCTAAGDCGQHNFCKLCLRAWILAKRRDATCPICRRKIQTDPSQLHVNLALAEAIAAYVGSISPGRAASSPKAPATSPKHKQGRAVQQQSSRPIDPSRITYAVSADGSRVVLGSQSPAAVYAATLDGVDVAVRCLEMAPQPTLEQQQQQAEDLWRAINLHEGLRHDNIVPISGVAVVKDASDQTVEVDIVQPRMDCNLQIWLDSNGRAATLVRRLQILIDVAAAMQYLHAKGIAHGRLQPSNVLLDSNGTARLSDFRHAVADHNNTGSPGTPRSCNTLYTDPAMPAGCAAGDPCSDIFCFGLMAWPVLTGRVPFADVLRDGSVDVALERLRAGTRPPLSLLSSDGGPDLPALIKTCWSGTQAERPSAAQVHARLTDIVANAKAAETAPKRPKAHAGLAAATSSSGSDSPAASPTVPSPALPELPVAAQPDLPGPPGLPMAPVGTVAAGETGWVAQPVTIAAMPDAMAVVAAPPPSAPPCEAVDDNEDGPTPHTQGGLEFQSSPRPSAPPADLDTQGQPRVVPNPMIAAGRHKWAAPATMTDAAPPPMIAMLGPTTDADTAAAWDAWEAREAWEASTDLSQTVSKASTARAASAARTASMIAGVAAGGRTATAARAATAGRATLRARSQWPVPPPGPPKGFVPGLTPGMVPSKIPGLAPGKANGQAPGFVSGLAPGPVAGTVKGTMKGLGKGAVPVPDQMPEFLSNQLSAAAVPSPTSAAVAMPAASPPVAYASAQLLLSHTSTDTGPASTSTTAASASAASSPTSGRVEPFMDESGHVLVGIDIGVSKVSVAVWSREQRQAVVVASIPFCVFADSDALTRMTSARVPIKLAVYAGDAAVARARYTRGVPKTGSTLASLGLCTAQASGEQDDDLIGDVNDVLGVTDRAMRACLEKFGVKAVRGLDLTVLSPEVVLAVMLVTARKATLTELELSHATPVRAVVAVPWHFGIRTSAFVLQACSAAGIQAQVRRVAHVPSAAARAPVRTEPSGTGVTRPGGRPARTPIGTTTVRVVIDVGAGGASAAVMWDGSVVGLAFDPHCGGQLKDVHRDRAAQARLMDKLPTLVRSALKQAKSATATVQDFSLIGGLAHAPVVQHALAAAFPTAAVRVQDTARDAAVMGAAILAASSCAIKYRSVELVSIAATQLVFVDCLVHAIRMTSLEYEEDLQGVRDAGTRQHALRPVLARGVATPTSEIVVQEHVLLSRKLQRAWLYEYETRADREAMNGALTGGPAEACRGLLGMVIMPTFSLLDFICCGTTVPSRVCVSVSATCWNTMSLDLDLGERKASNVQITAEGIQNAIVTLRTRATA